MNNFTGNSEATLGGFIGNMEYNLNRKADVAVRQTAIRTIYFEKN